MEKRKTEPTANSHCADRRKTYSAPAIEVIEMENEGSVMSTSGNIGDFGGGGSGGGVVPQSSRNTYNSSSASELEDMINDILTFEQ